MQLSVRFYLSCLIYRSVNWLYIIMLRYIDTTHDLTVDDDIVLEVKNVHLHTSDDKKAGRCFHHSFINITYKKRNWIFWI